MAGRVSADWLWAPSQLQRAMMALVGPLCSEGVLLVLEPAVAVVVGVHAVAASMVALAWELQLWQL